VARLGTTRFRGIQFDQMRLSRNGRWIVSGGSQARVIDAVTGKTLLQIGRPEDLFHVDLSRDDRWLVAANHKAVDVWDLSTFKKRQTFPSNKADLEVNSVAITHDGEMIAVSTGGRSFQVELRERRTGKVLRKMQGVDSPATHLEFSGDGSKLIGFLGERTVPWDVATGRALDSKRELFHGLSPDGSLAISSSLHKDERGRFEDRETFIRVRSANAGPKTMREIKLQVYGVHAAVLSPDNQLLAVSAFVSSRDLDGGFRSRSKLFDLASGKEVPLPKNVANAVEWLRFSHDGTLFLGGHYLGSSTSIRFWDRTTGEPVREVVGHTEHIHGLRFLADGKTVATLSQDRTVRLWSADDGRLLRVADAMHARGTSLVAAPDGSRLAWISPGGFYVWDVKDDRPPVATRFLVFDPRAAVISPDSRWLTIATGEGAVQLYDLATRDFRRTLATVPFGPSSMSDALAYSPDGATVYFSAGSELYAFDAKTGKERFKLGGPEGNVFFGGCYVAPDGNSLTAHHSDRSLLVWNLARKNARPLWQSAKSETDGLLLDSGFVDYSPDGALLAVGPTGGTVQVWETVSFAKVCEWNAQDTSLSVVRFSPDGKRLATATVTGADALLWDVNALLQAARPAPAEWKNLWSEMAQPGADKGQWAAHRFMQAGPDVVPFLVDRLKEMFASDGKGMRRVPDLLEELDAPSFERREKAQRELTEMGLRVLPLIRKHMERESSLEVRRRIERLLRAVEDRSEKQRWHLRRVVQVLEAINTPAAREQLQRLAADGHEKEMASAALTRMAKKP
jgi:WD40 repeat protein